MDKRIFQFTLIGIVAIIVFIRHFYFSKKAVVGRNLKKFPLKRISDFKGGERGRITGSIVYVDTPLEAPLSGRKCSHYYVHIEQYVSSGKSGSWHTRVKKEISGTVVVKDGDNYAMIKRANLESYIVQDKEYYSGAFNDATPHLEKYLNEHGYKSEGFLGFNKKMRYKEGILEDGERVTVAGFGEWKQAEDIGLPIEYGKVLVIHCGDNNIYMSDAEDIVNLY